MTRTHIDYDTEFDRIVEMLEIEELAKLVGEMGEWTPC
jgi:hypothetical protein